MADNTLPDDFPRPNVTDDSRVPAMNGTADTDPRDPTNTLLPDSVSFDVTANTWTAVTLNPGTYSVKGRDDGQVVYVAPAADAKSALRIAKQFDIETQQRAVLYIKGQTALDSAMVRIEGALAGKADIDSVYNKEQTKQLIDMLIEASLAGLTNIMTFKGVVDTLDDLPTDDVEVGDVYQVLEDGGFYTIKETTQPYEWERLSGSIIDIEDYYTKSEIDLMLSEKASAQDVAELRGELEGFIPPFTYEQGTDPALDGIDGSDPTKEGDTWFDTERGLIFIRKTSQVDGTLQWFNGLESYFVVKSNDFVKLEGKQTISGEKLFAVYPKMDSDMLPTNGREFITLDYLNARLGGNVGGGTGGGEGGDGGDGGGGNVGGIIDTSDFARLSKTNNFESDNYFTKQPIIDNPADVEDISYFQLLTKSQVVALVEAKFVENPTLTSPQPLASLTNDSLITKGDLIAYVAANGGGSGNAGGGEGNGNGNGNGNGAGSGNGSIVDVTNFAKLDDDNTFTGINTFEYAPRSNAEPTQDTELVPLAFLRDAIATNNAAYTDTEGIQRLLDDYVLKSQLTAVMTYKGSVNYDVDLQAKDKQVGDVWYVKNEGDNLPAGFVVWNGTSWDSLGSSVTTIDMSDLAKLQQDNTFGNSNTFLLTKYKDGVPVLSNSFEVEGMLLIDSESMQMNHNKFQLDSTGASFFQPLQVNIGNAKQVASFTNDYILLHSNPRLVEQKEYIDLQDNELITKYQAKKLIVELAPQLGGGGGTTTPPPAIDTTNLAKLDANNEFTGVNEFLRLPTLSMNPTSDTQAARKAYVDSVAATKADAADVYLKAQMDTILQDYALKAQISSFMEFKGSVADFNYLPAVPVIGDVYHTQAATPTKPAGFYVFTTSGWQALGSSAVTIDDSNLAKLNEANDFKGANTFAVNPIVITPNAANPNALITKNEADAAITAAIIAATSDFIRATDNIDFTGTITFSDSANFAQTPTIGQDNIATEAFVLEQLAAYVPSGGGGGGDIDTTNLAVLDGDNVFTGTNEFDTNPTITNPKELADIAENELITKSCLYIENDSGDKVSLLDLMNEIKEYGANLPIISNTLPNTLQPNRLGRLWIKTSYLKEGEKLLQKPSMYVCVYTTDTTSVWYDVHKEEMLGV